MKFEEYDQLPPEQKKLIQEYGDGAIHELKRRSMKVDVAAFYLRNKRKDDFNREYNKEFGTHHW